MSEVTRLLEAAQGGDRHAAAELLPLVYDELRKLAAVRMADEAAGQTLQPTALVHEAYLRLVGRADDNRWDNRGHFFAAAAEAMRRILVEAARRKHGPQHGGNFLRQDLDLDETASAAASPRLLEGGGQRVKITDFGLARAADDASISQSGLVAGTPMYMAPEQARGATLDQRADLFSLGSVLYVMAAGRPPFRANGTLAVLKRVAEDDPRPIREVIPETPQWLCDIISRLHAKQPDDRFASAREVADVLADCEARLKANAKLNDFPRVPHSKPPAAPSLRSLQWRRAAVAILLVVVLLAAGVVWFVVPFSITVERGRRVSLKPKMLSAPVSPPDNATEETAIQAADPDRRAAEYVLSLHGVVKVNEQEPHILAVADLPRETFRLTYVYVRSVQLADNGLARFKGCKNLVHLGLDVTDIDGLEGEVTDAGLVHFKDCKNLTDLSLYHTQVSDAGIAAFIDCKNLTNLNLNETQVGGVGLAQLKDCKALRVLQLGNSRITDAGLASLKNFEGLTKLTLWQTPVSDAGLVLFAGLDNLTDLDLRYTKVTGRGLKGLAKMLPKCEIRWDGGVIEPYGGSDRRAAEYVLSVGGIIEIDREREITALATLPKIVFRLTRADLSNNPEVTDVGLAAFEGCQNLNVLDLTGTPVTDAGLAHLVGLSELKNLHVAKTKVTSQGIAELTKALPQCKITWETGVVEPKVD